jgi:response regulator RpfG family c-di-GMP phosphodiesterase
LTEDLRGNKSESDPHLWTGSPRRVLVLDDDQLIVRAVARMLRSVGLTVEGTTDAEEALAIVSRAPPHAFVSDLHMPQACGAIVLATVASLAPSTMRVLMSADPDFEPRGGSLAAARVHALMSKADLRKLSGVLVEQLRGREELPEEPGDREALAKRVAHALARPLHENDEHRERVARLTVSVASAMGLPQDDVEHARLGAILHDVGQVTIRERVLSRNGPLTPEERGHMATHTDAGARIVSEMPALRDALPVIRGHHERQDGSGYPARAPGGAIAGSICAFQVADAYDAMTSGRPYTPRRSHREAVASLTAGAGTQHARDAVAALTGLGEDGLAAALHG